MSLLHSWRVKLFFCHLAFKNTKQGLYFGHNLRKIEIVLRRSLFKAQSLKQELVVDQELLGPAIFYRGQVYHLNSC